jgi:hypothetical protein
VHRSMSALIMTIVSAALAARAASAQQAPAPNTLSQSSSTTSAPTSKSNSTADSTVYGMTATRGARYLLRNGLDYLNYKEYDRALKFLREAEGHEKELNDAERLALKQGIERAQRGLREPSDIEDAYAVSDRSRPRRGFSAAKPESRFAVTDDKPVSDPGSARRATVSSMHSEGDDQGEPIRLTSSDSPPRDLPLSYSSRIRSKPSAPDRLPASSNPRGNLTKLAATNAARTLPVFSPLTQPLDPEGSTSTERTDDARAELTPPGQTGDLASQPLVSAGGQNQGFERQSSTVLSAPVPPQAANPQVAASQAAPDGHLQSPVLADPEPAPLPDLSPASAPLTDPKPIETRSQTKSGIDAKLDVSSSSLPRAQNLSDDLPPLPTNPGQSPLNHAGADPALAQATSQPASLPAPATPEANDLPPLPAELKQPTVVMSTDPQAAALGSTSTATPMASLPTGSTETVPAMLPASPVSDRLSDQSSTGTSDAVNLTAGDADTVASSPPAGAAAAVKLGEQTNAAGLVGTQPSTSPLAHNVGANNSSLEAVASQPYPTENPNLAPTAPNSAATSVAVPVAVAFASSTPAQEAPTPGINDTVLPRRTPGTSSLRPDQFREVERIARMQEDQSRPPIQNPTQPPAPPADTTASDLRTQTQLDISRAPSPAEARPIKAIPVPDDWVPLTPRDWTPQRKYWAAAATCHLPLYFQDPVLERYGHSVEQYVGPVGRYLSYPVDDPTQSTQRNQIVQPLFSWGLFCMQIIAWPYNLIMDPPWEAQYDLGYYRPGDNIPTDLYWLPLHGYGPPLHGKSY